YLAFSTIEVPATPGGGKRVEKLQTSSLASPIISPFSSLFSPSLLSLPRPFSSCYSICSPPSSSSLILSLSSSSPSSSASHSSSSSPSSSSSLSPTPLSFSSPSSFSTSSSSTPLSTPSQLHIFSREMKDTHENVRNEEEDRRLLGLYLLK